MVGPWCKQGGCLYQVSGGKTVTTQRERERGTARALSKIMRRKSIREKHKKTLRERQREGGKRVVRWVGRGVEKNKDMGFILLLVLM